MQIKKKILSLLLAFVSLFMPTKAYAREVQSDVADQKSIIEEQTTIEMPIAGAGIFFSNQDLKNDIVFDLIDLTTEEIEILSPYVEIIDNLSDDEKELICRVTWREAGNQCSEGQRAVMEIILNRLESDKWPDNIEEILSSPHQFSTWRLRNYVTEEQLEQMYDILDLVYTEEIVLPDNEYVYFNCAEHSSKDCIQIQGHWFWK